MIPFSSNSSLFEKKRTGLKEMSAETKSCKVALLPLLETKVLLLAREMERQAVGLLWLLMEPSYDF